MQATWNGEVLAESDDTIIVEGNHYFPRDSLNGEFFGPNDRTSRCFWKGTAEYFDVNVKGEINPAAAWHYPEPLDTAEQIRDRVAFWNGIRVG